MTLRIEVPAVPRPEPAQQQPAPPSVGAPEPVDLTGDGMANAIGVRDSSGRFLHLQPLPGTLIPAGAPMGQVHVDLTGDGIVDSLQTAEMQQYQQQMQQRGAVAVNA